MRVEQITFTRFLASLSIIIYHYGSDIFPFNLTSLFKHANVGVSYFFILSGFVMIIAYYNKKEISILTYLKNRFARIYPVYLLAILILFVFKLCFSQNIPFKGIALNTFIIQAWVPGKALSFNSPGWSLVVEFFFYSCFPFLFNLIYKKIIFKKLIVPIVLIFVLSQFVFYWLLTSSFYKGYPSSSHDLIFYFPPMHLNEFLIGNLAGLLYMNKFQNWTKNYDWAIVSLTIILFSTMIYFSNISLHNGILAVLFLPLIFLVSTNNGVIAKISTLRSLVFLGEISYGMYILQKPIFTWVKKTHHFFNSENEVFIFYSSLLVLTLFSALSYLLIETPLREAIKKIKISFQH